MVQFILTLEIGNHKSKAILITNYSECAGGDTIIRGVHLAGSLPGYRTLNHSNFPFRVNLDLDTSISCGAGSFFLLYSFT